MNVFTTDHPITAGSFRISRRVRRWLVVVLLAYPAYLLLVGPFWALDGRGHLDFIPEPVRLVCYAPACPIWLVPHLRGRYADYPKTRS